MWCVPKLDELYIERMNDILDLYARPRDEDEPFICVDEKNIHLLEDMREPLLLKTRFGIRVDSHYKKKGTRTIFACVDPKGGKRMIQVTERKTKFEYAEFIYDVVNTQYPHTRKVHLVADNFKTHSLKNLKEALGARYHEITHVVLHFTPAHASWLNQAEFEIGVMERQCLNRRRFPDEKSLKTALHAWARERNSKKIGIKWTFTKKQARVKFNIDNVTK